MSHCFFHFRGLVKLWSAMTLFSYYQDRQCAITVIQV